MLLRWTLSLRGLYCGASVMPRRSLLILPAALCCLALAGTRLPATTGFGPLDGGRAAVQGVRILAMAMGPDGTVYAGGRDTRDARTPGQPNPLGLGSVFLISHDQGAHWIKRVNDEPAPGYVAHYPAWTDHTRWPPNFTVYQMVVDPRHPTTLYAAGGFPYGKGGRGSLHLLLRSSDGGQTWTDALIRRVNLNARPPLVTNIVVTPANRQTLTYTRAESAPALALDPHDSRRLYLVTDWLGVLRSMDGGVSWQYNPNSPTIGVSVSEQIAVDPKQPGRLYVLVQGTTFATLYRSDDSGLMWHKVRQQDQVTSSMLLEGQNLYLTGLDGVYASTDGGVHWRKAVNARTLTGFAARTTRSSTGIVGRVVQAVHDQRTAVWIVMVANDVTDKPKGLYAVDNSGRAWRFLTDGMRGLYGALATDDMQYGYRRLWLNDKTQRHILFTASQMDGLYRWSIAP